MEAHNVTVVDLPTVPFQTAPTVWKGLLVFEGELWISVEWTVRQLIVRGGTPNHGPSRWHGATRKSPCL
jgi:hypothetical protein